MNVCVVRAGGYYGLPFRGERGMTEEDPLLPTIFNVVVDTVVRHWESLVAGATGEDISNNDNETGQTTEGRKIQGRDDGKRRVEKGHAQLKVQSYFFYADDGVASSTDPGWI